MIVRIISLSESDLFRRYGHEKFFIGKLMYVMKPGVYGFVYDGDDKFFDNNQWTLQGISLVDDKPDFITEEILI